LSFKLKEVMKKDEEAEIMEETLREIILGLVEKMNS
jgi:hypothetical protein